MKKFNKLYKKADRIMKKYNPCQINNRECFRHIENKLLLNFCCHECKHLDDSGCTIKNIWCKIWLCDIAISNLPYRIFVKLREIEKLANKYNLLTFRD